ncbi:PTS sugar transporter subunit IIB [Lactobacillus melliventris]|uniref:PTS system mannose/fructose/N-acetylgalactosamine-transporter subunit IIB n=1 Tax=Lactobacillus melliventris TaxID=1218507 RepID=UPI00158104E2|nr:PTS sugar transporter subunit IIB [Lactobacillus melliventris]MBC6370033.1 PTS mannose/fructose/sorbose transporter subunit IIB [Lactobacillus kullabergensis]NUE98175.1 PTS sugar transporter subunit IIB [Lactobacillus melliventris]
MTESMEGIIHVRIDDRMIHGQVATQWSGRLNATRIMVINDSIVNDDMRKTVVRLAAPANVSTSILGRQKALSNIKSGKYKGQRVLLICVSPMDVNYLIDNGLPIKSVNVGNLAQRDGTERIRPSVNVTPEEKEAFKKLIGRGVEVTVIPTPQSPTVYLKDYI